MSLKVVSHGGSDTVTGSRHELQFSKGSYLIDCGLFQGEDTKLHKNKANLPFNIHQIKGVFLTHAHLDHCGYLPSLALKGYHGPIFCTQATRDLAEVILRDSAKIQQYQAKKHNKKLVKTSQHIDPLYRTADVEAVLKQMKIVDRDEYYPLDIGRFRFFNAGHIPGACSLSLEVGLKSHQKKLLFSGDLGRNDDFLMKPPQIEGGHDVVFLESTYGDQTHPKDAREKSLQEISSLIKKIKSNRGILLIPAFTVARTQMILAFLHTLFEKEKGLTLPVFMDSPMGLQVNALFKRHVDDLNIDRKTYNEMLSRVEEIDEPWEEGQLKKLPGPYVLISSSGMMTGGKVLGHFARLAFDPENIIFLPGYQGKGTLGRELADGKREFSFEKETLTIKCEVVQSDAFSAHGDKLQLTDWLKTATKGVSKPQVYLIHGEPEVKKHFKGHLIEEGFEQVDLLDFEKEREL